MPDLVLPDGAKVPEHVFIEACRMDPNPFIEYVLDIDQQACHEEIQDFYTGNDECAVGEHRGLGKTTQTYGRVAWEIGRAFAPEGRGAIDCRWKYVQVNIDEATISVDAVKRIIESDRYRQVFPWVIPDMTMWGSRAFRILDKRAGVVRDPTLQACGIFGHAGGRATDFVFDDVCDLENSVRQSSKRSQVIDAYHNTWRKMLTGDRKRCWHIFTPWHEDDLGMQLKKRHEPKGTLLWRPVVDYRSPWADAFSAEFLRDDEARNPIAYQRGYLLNPATDDTLIWPEDWLRGAMFQEIPQRSRTQGYWAQTIDFAFTDKKQMGVKGATPDPDWSVSLIAWIDKSGHAWVHDMLRMRATFPDFKRAALDHGQQWCVTRGKAESVAGQRGLVQQMQEESPYPIEHVTRSGKGDKTFRGAARQSFVSQGRFHIKAGEDGEPIPALNQLFVEMRQFPLGAHDDTCDTAMDLMDMASSSRPGGSRPRRVAPGRDRVKDFYGVKGPSRV